MRFRCHHCSITHLRYYTLPPSLAIGGLGSTTSSCRFSRFFGCRLLTGHRPQFFQASCFTCQAAQIVELFTAHASMADNFNFLNTWRIEEECTLNTDAVRDTAHCEVAINAAATQAHDDTLERLQTFADSFDDFYLQAHGIA